MLRAPRLARCFSSRALPPGLLYLPQFLPVAAQTDLTQNSIKLLRNIRLSCGEKRKTTTSLSQQHNLSSDEYYQKVQLVDKDEMNTDTNSTQVKSRKRRAQYFHRYGESGHELTYFMNNSNIPYFVWTHLVSKLTQLKEIRDLAIDSSSLNWMFTFNAYSATECPQKGAKKVIPGFPFHVDSDFNGDVTVIFTLMAPALMELRPLSSHSDMIMENNDEDSYVKLELDEGSLLLLSGEARWQWQHRVVPRPTLSDPACGNMSHNENTCGDGVKRISLVLGCRDTSGK